MKFLVTFLVCLLPILSWGGPSESKRQFFEEARNLLENPGMEAGKATYTISGGTSAVETSAPLFGKRSLKWDASATSQTFSSDQYTIPAGLKGQDCEVSVKYLWDSGSAGDLALEAYDGTNILATADLSVTSGVADSTALIFSCPTSGTIGFRVSSTANAAEVTLDSAHVGGQTKFKDISTAELYGTAKTEGAASCVWLTTSGSYANFPLDTDCSAPTVTGEASAPATKIPGVTFANLPPGKYSIRAHGAFAAIPSTTTTQCYFRITDGTTSDGYNYSKQTTASDQVWDSNVIHGDFIYSTAQSSVTFQIEASRAAGDGDCRISADSSNRTFKLSVFRYPLGSEKAITLDNADWHIDVNIGGANPALDSGAQSSYVNVTNSGLDMVINSGSRAAGIPCSGNPTTGLTCSAGDEIVGVTIPSIPKAGLYEVCLEASIELDCAAGGSTCSRNVGWQLIETLDSSTSIVSEGKSRTTTYMAFDQGATTQSISMPLNICGIFNWSSVGQKVVKLAYEQPSPANLTAYVLGDRSAAVGQRDIHITVRPWTQASSTHIVDNAVVAETMSVSSGSHTSSGGWQLIPFDTIANDTNGGFSAGSSSYTVQVSGYYFLNAQVGFTTDTGGQVGVRIKVDSTIVMQHTSDDTSGSVSARPNGSKLKYITAGQVITAEAYQASGGSETYQNNTLTFLDIHLVGR
jgi:hypothetical protein